MSSWINVYCKYRPAIARQTIVFADIQVIGGTANKYFKLSTKPFAAHTSVTDIHKRKIALQVHKKALCLNS